jgi:hypothetical protein
MNEVFLLMFFQVVVAFSIRRWLKILNVPAATPPSLLARFLYSGTGPMWLSFRDRLLFMAGGGALRRNIFLAKFFSDPTFKKILDPP